MLSQDEYKGLKAQLNDLEQSIPVMLARKTLDGLTSLELQARIDWLRHELRKERPQSFGRPTVKMAVGALRYDTVQGCWTRRR